MASPSLAHSRVPLTKPPLTALAVAKLAEVIGEDSELTVILSELETGRDRSSSADSNEESAL